VKRCTSDHTAFAKLAKMNVVRTLRECPERYMKPYANYSAFLRGFSEKRLRRLVLVA
jgi:hypothetical protein